MALESLSAALADFAVTADHGGLPGSMTSVARFGPSKTALSKCALQRLRSLSSREVAVEGSKRQVPGLSSYLENEAIGEIYFGPFSECRECCRHGRRFLDRQIRMIECGLYGLRNSAPVNLIYGLQDPERFHENDVRHPHAGSDEILRDAKLVRIVPNNQANEDVRINRAHGEP